MTPKTHILLKRGTQIPCTHLLLSHYKINEVWYKIMPRPLEAIAPSIIQSQMVNDWEYKSPASLATSGIYTEKDLKKLRERINFPMERPALLNVLAREMSRIPLSETDDSIINLFDERALEKLAESTWNKTWNKFMVFGTASAGVIGLLLILQVVKMCIDTFIRGYTLHRIYGCSIHLVGAIFASITALIVHLGTRDEREEQQRHEEMRMIPSTTDPHSNSGTVVQPKAPTMYPNPNPTNETPNC